MLCDPVDYGSVADAITNNGGTDLALRRQLAAKCFALTAAYDCAIASWLAKSLGEDLPSMTSSSGRKILDLRYGENPHQKAALYKGDENRPGVTSARQIQ